MECNVFLVGITAEENLTCPKCGALVSKGDKFCKNCGAELAWPQEVVPSPVPAVPPYERSFSMVERFWKLVVSPSEAMRDIAGAPDYSGVLVIIMFQIVVAILAVLGVMQKIRFVGPSQQVSWIWGFVGGIMAFAVILSGLVLVGFWMLKSLIVKHSCDNGSGWTFKVAAAVTGYAYISDLIFGVLGAVVVWVLLPQFTVDVSSVNAATQSLANFTAQANWLKLWYSLPFSFIGLAWKSYLGSLGTRFGTKEKCSLGRAFVVFFVLGLVGVLFGFINRW